MRKRGHLSLVPTTPGKAPEPVDSDFPLPNLRLIEFPVADPIPLSNKYSIQQRLNDAEKELSSMSEIIDAALFMMHALPIEKIRLQELRELQDVFMSGESLLDVYGIELSELASSRLTAQETRKLARVKKIFKQLRSTLPEASGHLNAAIQIAQGNGRVANNRHKNTDKFKPKPDAPNGIQIKVTLKGSKPPIWRRVRVPGDCSLGELHYTIQQSMGWDDEHMHRFFIQGNHYSNQSDDCDENEWTLLDLNCKPGTKFEYVYDFGDNWVHLLEVEKILDEPHNVLECVTGRRACPPEDSGGIAGYYQKLEILKNPEHAEYEAVLEWLGEDFNPNGF